MGKEQGIGEEADGKEDKTDPEDLGEVCLLSDTTYAIDSAEFGQYAGTCVQSTQDPEKSSKSSNHDAKGYNRVKIQHRNLLVKTLVDSGNLFGTLISEELRKKMHLPMCSQGFTVGTASKTGAVQVLGRTCPVKLVIEHLQKVVTITPWVMQDLAHPINLGTHFLRENGCSLWFNARGVSLKMGDSVTELTNAHVPVNRPSTDSCLVPVLEKANQLKLTLPILKRECDILDVSHPPPAQKTEPNGGGVNSVSALGVNYDDFPTLGELYFRTDRVKVQTSQATFLPARTKKVILGQVEDINSLDLEGESTLVCFDGQPDCPRLRTQEIFLHPGIYHLSGRKIKLKVSNYSDDPFNLHKGRHVGYIYRKEGVAPTTWPLNVNALKHTSESHPTIKGHQEKQEFVLS